jgi:exopolysaccharide/PEP-CTERM locus tyrosine autokinase
MIRGDDMKDGSEPMSTIEKAAARLAARSNAPEPAVDAAPLNPPAAAAMAARSPSYATAQAPQATLAVDRYVALDLKAISARGYLTPGAGRTPLAQQMRRLKRQLLLQVQRAAAQPANDDAPPVNLIMVTSSVPGEGKTFTAINLAMSMAAERDHRVLLVDADASRGDISRQFGLQSRHGLTGLLQESREYFDEEILETNVEHLTILPSGESVESVDELFASATMAGIVRGLAEADPERIVIFDSAPLLAATEVATLARLMGQVLLVVEANSTPQDAVMRSLALLEGCANVSLMLNKATADDADYGYGYTSYGELETGASAGRQPDSATGGER